MATKKTTTEQVKAPAKNSPKAASASKKNAPKAKKPAPQKSTAKKSKGGANVSPEQRKKNLERVAAANRRKNKFSQFVPFILFAFALILTVLLVLDIVGEANGTQLEGEVGNFICRYIMFGLFGPASYLFPVLLVIFGVFWFKAPDGITRAIKAVLSAMIIGTFSALYHIFKAGADIANMQTALTLLYNQSVALEAGGLLGGYVGWVCCWAFRWGSYIVLPFCLILLFFVLLEITPHQIWLKIKAAHAKRVERARLAALEEDENDYDDEDENYEDDYEDYEEEPVAPTKKKNKRGRYADDEDTIEINPRTGEVIEDTPGRARKDKKKRRDDDEDEDDSSFHPLKMTDGKDADDAAVADAIDGASVTETVDEDAADKEQEGLHAEFDELAEGVFADDGEVAEFEVELEDDGADSVFGRPALKNATRKKPEPQPEPEPEDETEALLDDLLAEPEDEAEQSESEPIESVYVFPTTDMLAAGSAHYHTSQEEIDENVAILRQTLEDFHIRVKEVTCSTGPTVTRYEIKPEAGVRVRAIANLVDDIALSLAKSGVRIEAPIPGKAAVGIEVPNDKPATVFLRNLLESPEFINHKSKVAVCLGADVSGKPVVFDIEKMPHLLVAGATGMGKSVCINCLVMSLLYKARPDEVKLIMIDPKKVEFTTYRDIPHLYCPIVSDPKKAAGALASAVAEMERRFSLIEEVGVRNITGYNEITKDDPEKEYLPRLVIIIDELADLMMTAPDDVETCICRLAQKARAAGIHIIIGTQRPSVDVVTGLIKANIPSRIAFTVSSQVDSRTIIDVGGAEKLIGRGDMLYAPVGCSKPMRVQGAFVSDGEVERVVNFVKTQNGSAKYNDSFTRQIDEEAAKCGNAKKGAGGGAEGDLGGDDGEDEKLWEAVEVVVTEGKASTSMLQRYLKVGYGRAAGLLDRMEELGFISAQDGNKPRKVLVTKADLDELRMNGKAD